MNKYELMMVNNINRKIKMDQNLLSSFSIRVYLFAIFCHLHCCGQCLAAPLTEEVPGTIGKDSMSKSDELSSNVNYGRNEIYNDESTESFEPSVLVSHNPLVNIFPIYELR